MGITMTQVSGWVPANARSVGIGNRVVSFAGSATSGSAGRYAIFDVSSGFVGAWEVTPPAGYTIGSAGNAIEYDGRAWAAFGGFVVSVNPLTGGCIYYPINATLGNVNTYVLRSSAYLMLFATSQIYILELATGEVRSATGGSTGSGWASPASGWWDSNLGLAIWNPSTTSSTGTPAPRSFRSLDPVTGVSDVIPAPAGVFPGASGRYQPASRGGKWYCYDYRNGTNISGLLEYSGGTFARVADGKIFGTSLVVGPDNRFWTMVGSSISVWDPDSGIGETQAVTPTRTVAATAAVAGGRVVFPTAD